VEAFLNPFDRSREKKLLYICKDIPPTKPVSLPKFNRFHYSKLFRSGIAFLFYFLSRPEPELTHFYFGLVQFGVAPSENIKEFSE
jgi:hypothetical protein